MEEKIKIYIPKSVNAILLKDMENFEFFKKDGSLNRNEFYNTLILNYYEQYEKGQGEIFSHIQEVIRDSSSLKDSIINDIAANILQYIDVRNYDLSEQKYDIAIAVKPTRKTASDIEYIQNYLLADSTLSNYFRNMFASYALLPQDRREAILFKDTFEKIKEAIETDRKIYFTTKKNDNPHIVSPYRISNSKEELFNYLICQYKYYPYSFRVCRIRQVKILNEGRELEEGMKEIFDKMILYGPQFAYQVRKPAETIKVQLTDRGREMFKSMYLHRPQPSSVDGDIYSFDCSRTQAFQYFCKFGSNALVLEPKDLQADLHRFHAVASKRYYKLARTNTDPGSEEVGKD